MPFLIKNFKFFPTASTALGYRVSLGGCESYFCNLDIQVSSILETELYFQEAVHSIYFKQVFYNGIIHFPLSSVSMTNLNQIQSVCLLRLVGANHLLNSILHNCVSPFLKAWKGELARGGYVIVPRFASGGCLCCLSCLQSLLCFHVEVTYPGCVRFSLVIDLQL